LEGRPYAADFGIDFRRALDKRASTLGNDDGLEEPSAGVELELVIYSYPKEKRARIDASDFARKKTAEQGTHNQAGVTKAVLNMKKSNANCHELNGTQVGYCTSEFPSRIRISIQFFGTRQNATSLIGSMLT